MTPAMRADVTNGIWLCANCHRIIDKDPANYPAGLLFEWKRTHEEEVSIKLGKTSVAIRKRVLERLPGFGDLGYLAQQIVYDKPNLWEYRLTAELLREKLEPLLWRWNALKSGLYAKPLAKIPDEEILSWFAARFSEVQAQVEALGRIVNNEFTIAWGPLGQPGSELAIIRACSLVAEASKRLLEWEETVRFTRLADEFGECKEMLFGVGGPALEQLFRIPEELSRAFLEGRTGPITIDLVFNLPDEWGDRYADRLEKAVGSYLRSRG